MWQVNVSIVVSIPTLLNQAIKYGQTWDYQALQMSLEENIGPTFSALEPPVSHAYFN